MMVGMKGRVLSLRAGPAFSRSGSMRSMGTSSGVVMMGCGVTANERNWSESGFQ